MLLGLRPPQGLPGAQPVTPVGVRPPVQPMYSHADGLIQTNQQNARDPVIDNFHANEPSNGEENFFDSKDREPKENNDNVPFPSSSNFLFCSNVELCRGQSFGLLLLTDRDLNGFHIMLSYI